MVRLYVQPGLKKAFPYKAISTIESLMYNYKTTNYSVGNPDEKTVHRSGIYILSACINEKPD